MRKRLIQGGMLAAVPALLALGIAVAPAQSSVDDKDPCKVQWIPT